MTLANTPEKANEVLTRLKASTRIVYDAETSGFNPHKNYPVGHVLTFGPGPGDTYYVPIRHKGGGNLPGATLYEEAERTGSLVPHFFEREMVSTFQSKSRSLEVGGHNLAFDLGFLHSIGDEADNKYVDTQINAFVINELRESFSLDACCRSEHVQPKKGEPLYHAMAEWFGGKPERSQMGNYWRTNAEEFVVWDYAAGDGTSTWQLCDAQMERIRRPIIDRRNGREHNNLENIWALESALIPVLAKIVAQGIRVDLNRAEEIRDEFQKGYTAAMEAVGNINVRAPSQIKAFLESQGIDQFPKTSKGNISFNEEWLLTHEPGQKIIACRKYRTIVDTYINPLLSEHLIGDRFYPNYNQTRGDDFGTITGRLSSNNPNLQSYPGKRQYDLAKIFRQMFIPNDGLLWQDRDYANCEIRIAAHYCKAKTWLRAFKEGVSPHQTVSDDIGIKYSHAKSINLGLMTGMGKRALAEDLGMELRQGSAVVDRYFKGLPELRKWQADAKNIFQHRGWVRTLAGRILHLSEPKYAYRGVNRLTQGGNADIIKSAMVRIHEDTGVVPLANVHDSLAWQSDDEELDREIENIMCDVDNRHFKMSVPLAIEGQGGKNWSEASM